MAKGGLDNDGVWVDIDSIPGGRLAAPRARYTRVLLQELQQHLKTLKLSGDIKDCFELIYL